MGQQALGAQPQWSLTLQSTGRAFGTPVTSIVRPHVNYPNLCFYLDANCVNAKQKIQTLNDLEQWRDL